MVKRGIEKKIEVPDLGLLLRDVPTGNWAAISKDFKKVLGTGVTLQEALEKAKKNGEDNPIVTKPMRTNLILRTEVA